MPAKWSPLILYTAEENWIVHVFELIIIWSHLNIFNSLS